MNQAERVEVLKRVLISTALDDYMQTMPTDSLH